MAAIFKNATRLNVGNSNEIIYKAPAGVTSYLIQFDVSSKGATGVQISAYLRDVSQYPANPVCIVKGAPVPVGSAIQILDGQKLVVEGEDEVLVSCDTLGEEVDVIVSLVENVNS